MAKDTKESDFQPVTFTKTDDRGDHELTATSPSDAVRLAFDGWSEKKTSAASRAANTRAAGN